ncbi:HEAT repeat-containing protein 5B [Asparagus officinalis]|uniref:HEAT repeat-containing protein 5B n=1 Tax=Asparagus officinalis TaxID=4686 RepID=UPI00098E6851|nr:HEAT repeat-containing protein 5B [Asparagus officinalis]
MKKPRGDVASVPLSRFGVLVAQLESIAASARQQPPDPLLCFDLLSELVVAIEDEPKEAIQQSQRKCEDALYSLLILGARRPVRRLASLAMGKVIAKGDGISIYSRVSTFQGWLVDSKRNEPLSCSGAAQCLGELYRLFGRRITSGLVETANIAAKLMKYHEDFVRQDALQMLENALGGSGGSGASAAYSEAFRIIMRVGASDKSPIVRIAAARCLKTLGSIGGPGLGITELENSIVHCVKALEDPVSSVRDAFAEALGALLALAMNPDEQVKQQGKNHPAAAKKLDDCLQKHLISPFTRASGTRAKSLRIGLTLSWVFFLQVIRLKYHLPDSELQNFSSLTLDMLQGNASMDVHALACVLYILRVGITDQMTEPTQRGFLIVMARQLESGNYSPSVGVATLRILSYLLKILGEVPVEFRDILDSTLVAAMSHSSLHVRTEAALALRALAEVDPTCVGGLISYGMTTLHALRESTASGKGNDLSLELDALHGQATALAALVFISPKLLLGYPARLPKSVLEVSKRMLTESSRSPVAATVEKEAGWVLLASLISSMPKEELQDQVFDILLLWAEPFLGNHESYIRKNQDLILEMRVMTAAIEALTAFIKSFVCPNAAAKNGVVLLQPVLAYLSSALSYISSLSSKPLQNIRPALDLFTVKTLIAYQSVSDPMAYKTEHSQLMHICSVPFSDPSGSEESSCLRFLLDKRDACLGPWIPGRDWFEDELRAFDGGKDGLVPCVWEDEPSSFPQPDPVSKLLINQKLLCFGTIFATEDRSGMISLLNKIDQCLKTGKKLPYHAASITNACVALLAGLKALLVLRPQTLGAEILSSIQSIFQSILADGDTCPAQRRASSEGLGLLARLGNDIFTARMTRSLLGELGSATDPSCIGSIALSLGCIHCSAGGMALSTLVPATVSSISLLAKSSNPGLQLWALHALLLTIEAAGLSYVSQVQATLSLAMEILLSEENGLSDLRQELGCLINAIVAVLGPELAPGSTFFSRCKSAIAEISSCQETSTLLESVRFTQQLVLFAPQAVSVHSHVQSLLPTLSSKQPSLRYLAVSTLRHLIEKDPVAMVDEKIEENLFSMLNEETDSEIGSLVRSTITRLLYTSCPSCPSRWLAIFHNLVLATSTRKNASEKHGNLQNDHSATSEGDGRLFYGEDDEDMIASSGEQLHGADSIVSTILKREKHLRYRTRVFAAECLSNLPKAVGTDPAHFDLSMARKQPTKEHSSSGDWLVLHLQELLSLAYQISTGPFEGMQSIGVKLLSVIMEKFGNIPDPELPGHLLLEQYQAQLVSAVRSVISMSSGPLLLEAGLQLATKILTSSIISGDRVALDRMFSLISRPLNDIKDLYYPSFAEWVACKIKVRLLEAHASIKCYVYQFLTENKGIPEEYQQLTPRFSSCSSILGKYWICVLKDYMYISFGLNTKFRYNPFLDGIQSPLVTSKLQCCLEESWPLILQATSLDAVPINIEMNSTEKSNAEDLSKRSLISGHNMVKLEFRDYQFLWGLALLVLFHGQQPGIGSILKAPLLWRKYNHDGDAMAQKKVDLTSDEVWPPVLQSLSKDAFFCYEFLTLDLCQELLQVLIYADIMADSRNNHAVCLLSQIVISCPDVFFEVEDFTASATELYFKCLSITLQSKNVILPDLVSKLSVVAQEIARQVKDKKNQIRFIVALMSVSCELFEEASTNMCLPRVIAFLQNIMPFLKKYIRDEAGIETNDLSCQEPVLGAWRSMLGFLCQDCIKRTRLMENKTSDSSRVLGKILSFCLEEFVALTKLVHETLYCGRRKEKNHILLFAIVSHCTRCMRDTLNEENTQVQTIGLHVLKNIAQREIAEGLNMKNHSFSLFFIGEFFGDVFLLIQRTLKESISRESVSIIEECLRLLLLLYTLSKEREDLREITMLLLEALLMVFYVSSENYSQEITDVKNIVKRLVSHLVQIPSFAIQIKDIMLSMQGSVRLQLQDLIRESINQGHITLQTKISLLPKTPVQLKPNVIEVHQSWAPDFIVKYDDKNEPKEEDGAGADADDDDWDAFQSLPAANNAAGSSSSSHSDIIQMKPDSVSELSSPVIDHHYEEIDDGHLSDLQNAVVFKNASETQEFEISTGQERISPDKDGTQASLDSQNQEIEKDESEESSNPDHFIDKEKNCNKDELEETWDSSASDIKKDEPQESEVGKDETEEFSDPHNFTSNERTDCKENELEETSNSTLSEVKDEPQKSEVEKDDLKKDEIEPSSSPYHSTDKETSHDKNECGATLDSQHSEIERDEFMEISSFHHPGADETLESGSDDSVQLGLEHVPSSPNDYEERSNGQHLDCSTD